MEVVLWMGWLPLLFLGVWIIRKHNRDVKAALAEIRELEKYEFEHRTDGGVVQFPTFEAAEDHQKRMRVARFKTSISGGQFGQLGFWIALASLIWMAVVISEAFFGSPRMP